MSYCCTENVASIIKSHNKKLINTSMKSLLPCNCKKKHECTFDGKCRAQNIAQKCVNQVYTDTAEADFKQRFYNHRLSFNNKGYSTDNNFQTCLGNKEVQDNPITEMVHNQICTSLFKHLHEMSVVSARKNCILNYPNPNELLNKRLELISKCNHVSKCLLSNYISNDQNLWKMYHQMYIMRFQLLSKQ